VKLKAVNLKALIRGMPPGGFLVCALGLILLFPTIMHAQDDQPPASDQDAASASSDSAASDSDHDAVPEPGSTSTLDSGQVANHSGSSNSRVSALQWGHLAFVSYDAFYAYDSNFRFSPSHPQRSDAGASRALFTYAIGNERESLTIQYRPFVLVSQDQQDFDFGSSIVNFHMLRHMGSRWTFNLINIFSYSPNRGEFIDATISSSFSTGNVVQQSFSSITTELRGASTANFSNRIAAHDTVTFHAGYEYVNLSNHSDSISEQDNFQTTNTLNAGVAWSHALSSNNNIGIGYNYDRKYIQGFGGNSQFHSLILTYNQKIRPTLHLRIQVGPSLAVYDDGTPNRKALLASAVLLKKLNNSNFSALYTRDYSYDGIISNTYHDRFDGLYSRNFTPRWEASLGGGYVIDHPTFTTEVRSRTAWASLAYRFTQEWGLFASFSNAATEGGLHPFTTRNFLTVGLHWSGLHEK